MEYERVNRILETGYGSLYIFDILIFEDKHPITAITKQSETDILRIRRDRLSDT